MAQTASGRTANRKPDDKGAAAPSPSEERPETVADPVALLAADHRHVEQLFAEYQKADAQPRKIELARQVCDELVVHTLLEEEIFYPACQGRGEKRLLDEAQVEHDGAKALIVELMSGSPDDPFFDAKVSVLAQQIEHHVREEEKPDTGIFAKAKSTGIATPELAAELVRRKAELTTQAKADALGPPKPRSYRGEPKAGTMQPGKERSMARGSSYTMERERDDRGRFIEDDDDRRPPQSRRYYDDDVDRRGGSRMRDDEGRFMSRPRSRDEDDYRVRGGWYGDPERHSRASREGWRHSEHEGSGWYGDPEGHSRASREGWRHSEHEGSGWYGDPEGHSRASREGWRHSEHEGSGWYGVPEGHSRASREGWRHSEHEGSGWYGDPEGHSRASREGWDERGRSPRSRYDDDRRTMRSRDDEGRFTSTRSRSRYDDDDDDRRGGRGHGGWYGDPEGHAEAARQRRR